MHARPEGAWQPTYDFVLGCAPCSSARRSLCLEAASLAEVARRLRLRPRLDKRNRYMPRKRERKSSVQVVAMGDF